MISVIYLLKNYRKLLREALTFWHKNKHYNYFTTTKNWQIVLSRINKATNSEKFNHNVNIRYKVDLI